MTAIPLAPICAAWRAWKKRNLKSFYSAATEWSHDHIFYHSEVRACHVFDMDTYGYTIQRLGMFATDGLQVAAEHTKNYNCLDIN